MTPREQGERSREKLVAAMTDLARAKGYHATRIEDVCAAAGVSKGSFFHHFVSREAVGFAAAEAWHQNTAAFFADADFTRLPRGKDRVLAYVALRRALLSGPVAGYCCYAGTVVSETWASDAPVFHKARAAIDAHIDVIAAHVEAALAEAGKPDPVRAKSLSIFIQGTIQGALILAKSAGGAAPALDCLAELTRHLSRTLSPEDP